MWLNQCDFSVDLWILEICDALYGLFSQAVSGIRVCVCTLRLCRFSWALLLIFWGWVVGVCMEKQRRSASCCWNHCWAHKNPPTRPMHNVRGVPTLPSCRHYWTKIRKFDLILLIIHVLSAGISQDAALSSELLQMLYATAIMRQASMFTPSCKVEEFRILLGWTFEWYWFVEAVDDGILLICFK